MKIFMDDCITHRLSKRIIPVWLEMGHSISDNPSSCDIQLSFVRIKNKTSLPVVLRIDGVYYDSDTNYNVRNSNIKSSHSICDGVIYQSNFSRKMSDRYLGKSKKGCIETVIHNGIEPNWSGGFEKHEEINIVSSAKWRRHKRLEETIELFLEFNKIKPNCYLHILGDLKNNKIVRNDSIKYHGMVDWETMKKIYKISDMFIHLSKKDSCPNAVVEAISSGIPIITTNACGGATEMSKITNGCIICDGDLDSTDPCFPYRDDYNKLPKNLFDNIIYSMIQISNDKRRVFQPIELTSKYCAERYLDVFNSVLKQRRKR